MSLPKLKVIKKYLPPILFVLSLFFIIKTLFLNYYPDFKIHYLAPQAIINGLNPYLGGQNYFTPDVHPPFTIFLFSPFTLLSYTLAEKLWTLFSIFLLLGSMYLIFKINKTSVFSNIGLILSSLIFTFYFPIKFTLGMGQINFLILFLLMLSIYFLNKNRIYVSGICLSLSLMIKFFPILFLPYLLILKKWKMFFFIIMLCVMILLVTFMINPNINIYFYKNVLPTFFGGWKTDYYNQSLTGFLGRQMIPGLLREYVRIAISLLIFIISFFAVIKSKNKRVGNLEWALLITTNLLINNFSWQHHFVWLLFPLVTIFYFIRNNKLNCYYYLILGLSFFLIGLNLENPSTFPVIFISHVFYGALILWGFNLYLILKETSKVKT